MQMMQNASLRSVAPTSRARTVQCKALFGSSATKSASEFYNLKVKVGETRHHTYHTHHTPKQLHTSMHTERAISAYSYH